MRNVFRINVFIIIIVLFFNVLYIDKNIVNADDGELKKEYIEIYKAAEEKYGVPWNLLAGIHKVETNFSTSPSMESHAGAVGHMQFMPCTWLGWSHPSCSGKGRGNIPKSELTNIESIKKHGGFGVDGDGDGKADPYNLDDAIFSAANYLKANGASEGKYRKAVYAYNHAGWYVDKVLSYAEKYKDKGDGIEAKTGESTSTEDKSDSKKGSIKGERPKGTELFEERKIAKDYTGVDGSRNILGGDIYLLIERFSRNISVFFTYAGIFLVAGLFVYTSASILIYFVISTRGARGSTLNKFEKFTGTSLVNNKETTKKLLGRWLIVLAIIVIFLTGSHIYVMKFLITMFERIVSVGN